MKYQSFVIAALVALVALSATAHEDAQTKALKPYEIKFFEILPQIGKAGMVGEDEQDEGCVENRVEAGKHMREAAADLFLAQRGAGWEFRLTRARFNLEKADRLTRDCASRYISPRLSE